MTTVITRKLRSVPHRSAFETWEEVVRVVAARSSQNARDELLAIRGVAASLIADQAATAPIVIIGNGPRVRLYCLYDEAAIEGDDANEAPLSFDPFGADWTMSLPCTGEDLDWVNLALEKHSGHIRARDQTTGISVPEKDEGSAATFGVQLDVAGFLGK